MGYIDFIKSTQERGGNYSKASLVDLAMHMMNDSDAVIPVYTKKGDVAVVQEVHPGRAVRESVIVPFLKAFGVDKAELPRVDSIAVSRAGAEAMAQFSLHLVKEYISERRGLGRKLVLPMTSPDETVQSIYTAHVDEVTKATTKIVKDETGAYQTMPTGNETTTAAHDKLIVKNRIPSWLKTTRPVTLPLAVAA